jgi:hypothetical protein
MGSLTTTTAIEYLLTKLISCPLCWIPASEYHLPFNLPLQLDDITCKPPGCSRSTTSSTRSRLLGCRTPVAKANSSNSDPHTTNCWTSISPCSSTVPERV